MSSPGAGAAPLLHSTGLLIRLRLRRLANQVAAGATRKKPGDGKRTGNPGKRASRVVFFVLVPLMMLMFGVIARQAIVNLHHTLDPPGTFWLTVEFSAPLVAGVAFLLVFLWFAALLLTIASGELVKPDWDLEWLITLPIRSDTLLWARILERSLVNPSGVTALLPACTVIAWFSGFRWSALLVGALAAWPLLLLSALARTLLDTGLRLRMSAGKLRNLHALVSVLSIVVMYLAMSMGMKGKSDFMLGLASASPAWLAWTPMGLVVRALNERGFVDSLLFSLAALGQIALIVWLGVRLLRHQLRNGVVAGGARDAARVPRAATVTAPAPAPAAPRISLRPVQRRELTLLSRDRNFLVQSLVVPLLIVGGQLVLGTSGVATSMWHDPSVLASVAFGLAAYSLSMSAFQTLNTEGHALWLLYTFPCAIEDVLMDKAKLWGALTLVYPALMFAVGAVLTPELDWHFVGAALTTFLGIPIYAFIAVALGVFGSNPLEQHQNQKVKPEYVYLYMGLSGLYVYAIVTPDPWQRVVFMVLTLMLAFALWQKARDHLLYLLDPDVAPPPRVSTSDGLIAAMLFFVLQAVTLAVISGSRGGVGAALVAYTIAGGLTYALMRYVYARTKAEGVPRLFDRSSLAANRPLLGVLGGLAAACVAGAFLFALRGTEFLSGSEADSYTRLGPWALVLALVAAPVFEEFIFRGLIFGGLRRSFGAWPAALASAAIFTIVHPTVSALPVFVMGVCAALVYERSRSLFAPIVTHVVYNAGAIAVQVFLL